MLKNDGDLVPWTENFLAVANTNHASLCLREPDISNLTTKNTDYSKDLINAITKQTEVGTKTKITLVPNYCIPLRKTFHRVKAQKIDLVSDAGNVVGV